jgi:hypothetical protein
MCVTTPGSILSAFLLIELVVMCTSLGCISGPWLTAGSLSTYYLTYQTIGGNKITYDTLGSLDNSFVTTNTFGKVSIAFFVFGFLCSFLCFVFGMARIFRIYNPSETSSSVTSSMTGDKFITLLSNAPTVSIGILGIVMLLTAMGTGMAVAIRLVDKINDTSFASSFVAAIFNVIFAFVAVLCDSLSCCCCCRAANRAASRAEKQNLASSDIMTGGAAAENTPLVIK